MVYEVGLKSLQARQELDQIPQVALGQRLADVRRHGALASLALVDVGGLDRPQAFFRHVQHDLGWRLRLQHARNDFALLRADDDGLKTGGDVLLREKDRLQQVLARLLAADARQIGAGVAALLVDGVTLEARYIRALQEYLLTQVDVAAVEDFRVRRQVAAAAGGLEFLQLLLQLR